MISESVNLHKNITGINGNGEIVPIANMIGNLYITNNGININFNTHDKELVTANLVDVQAQVDEFMASFRTKMQEIGYEITI